jgi:hypothetical protein
MRASSDRHEYVIAGNDDALRYFNRVCRGYVSSLMRLKCGKHSALDIGRGGRKAQASTFPVDAARSGNDVQPALPKELSPVGGASAFE